MSCLLQLPDFGIIFVANDLYPKRESALENVAQNLAVGCFSGCVATCFKAPFDVVKSRIQNQARGPVLASLLRAPRQVTQQTPPGGASSRCPKVSALAYLPRCQFARARRATLAVAVGRFAS